MFFRNCLRLSVVVMFMVIIGFSQDDKVVEEQKKAEINPLEALNPYAPYAKGIDEANPQLEKEDYEIIKANLKKIEEVELKKIIYKVENFAKKLTDEIELQKLYLFDLFSRKQKFYYKNLSRFLRNDQFVHKTLIILKKIDKRMTEIEDSLAYYGAVDKEIRNIVYRIKKISGLFKLFLGDMEHIKEAVTIFEYLLGNNENKIIYAQGEKERREIYKFLIGSHQFLYELSSGNHSYYAVYNLQRELFYLWNLTISLTKENEKIKNYKLKKLANHYVKVINFKGENYKNLYKDYLDDKYKSSSQKTIDANLSTKQQEKKEGKKPLQEKTNKN